MAEDMEARWAELVKAGLRAGYHFAQSPQSYSEQEHAAVFDQIAAGEAALSALLSERRKMVEALEPFALLAASDVSAGVNMNDPLSKWLTIAQLQAARAALTGSREHG